MAVITTDILLEGCRRDAVFAWLGEPSNHARLLQGAFDTVKDTGNGCFDVTFSARPRTRTMGYRFVKKDDSHGGRRILVQTTGKRTAGELHYSLRTMKPSTNTMVTLRLDYSPGGMLGQLLDNAGLRDALESHLSTVLDNLKREIGG